MKQNDINLLLNSFFISDTELQQRSILRDDITLISGIIIDELEKNYIIKNPELSIFIKELDNGNKKEMVLNQIKTFLAYILIEDINEDYLEKVREAGFTSFNIKFHTAKVSYCFWGINEIINSLSKTNALILENRIVLSKVLKFVEHSMNKAYYVQKNKNISVNELENINAQSELYIGFKMHKVNLEKIDIALSNREDISILDDIKDNPSECSFGKILNEIVSNSRHEYILGTHSKEVNNIHNQWHHEFVQLKQAMISNDELKVVKHELNIKSLTKHLTHILNASLKDSLSDGQLSLSSGMKSMRKVTDSFYKKNLNNLDENMQKKSIDIGIEKTIHSEFSWAIESINTSYDEIEINNNDIFKTIRFNNKTIFIKITLHEIHNNSYINEIITLLLEVLELHFYVQERELSLVDFANKAQSANKSKDMFLANMSHELRTPINAITGFSQILMIKKDTPDFVKKYVEKINIAGNNLLDLVNTILDFAKLEAGKMQFTPSLSSVAEIISNVKDLISPLASKKNITLVMPNIKSLTLYIDEVLFKQVLVNLLSNAIKFTQKNGEVVLSITYNEQKRKYIFEVKDNGVGINQDDISKLFQSFSQIDNAYQKEHKGTGLGLMICKNIIEDLHKGKIWAQSTENVGSSFFVEMISPAIESNTYTVLNDISEAKHLLIVEDNEEYQKILIEKLKDKYILSITNSVNKAKELISKETYDFLLLDYFLNDGISSEILDFMDAEHINIPSIIISGEDELDISSSLQNYSNLKLILSKNSLDEISESINNEI